MIHTARLRLSAMREGVLTALLNRDAVTAGRLQGIEIPLEFLETIDETYLKNQKERIRQRPTSRAWCVRVMIREEDDTVIGHCGFHGHPDDVGRAEIGYLVFENHRGNGYATEAALGLIDWARGQGERAVFAAVSPDNHSSIRVAEKAGFHRVGVPRDDPDVQEYLFEMIFHVV